MEKTLVGVLWDSEIDAHKMTSWVTRVLTRVLAVGVKADAVAQSLLLAIALLLLTVLVTYGQTRSSHERWEVYHCVCLQSNGSRRGAYLWSLTLVLITPVRVTSSCAYNVASLLFHLTRSCSRAQ